MDQELVAYLDESFRSLRDYVDRRFERVEEEIRHTQILVEAGRGDIRMVAEGTYSLDERLGSFRKEVQQEFEDVRKLIRPVYSSLDQRIRTLEVRKDLQGRDPIELIKERFGLGKKPE